MYADTQCLATTHEIDLDLIERFVGHDAPQRLQWLDRVIFSLVRGGRLPPPPDTDVRLLMTTLNLNREISRVLTAALDPMPKTACVTASKRLLDTEALHPVYSISALAPYVSVDVAERHLKRYTHFAEALADAALESHREDLFHLSINQKSFERRLIFERIARDIVVRPDKACAALRFCGGIHDLITAFKAPATMREPDELFGGLVEIAWIERGLRPMVLQGLEVFRDGANRGRNIPWAGIDQAIEAVQGYR